MTNKKSFFKIPHAVFEDGAFKELQYSSQVLYCHLARHQNRYGKKETGWWFFRKMEELSLDTGIQKSTLKKAKDELLKEGFVERRRGHYDKQGFRSADEYRVKGL